MLLYVLSIVLDMLLQNYGLFGTRGIEQLTELRLREIHAHERHETTAVVIEMAGKFSCQAAAARPVAKSTCISFVVVCFRFSLLSS